jgi:hypothetical protein
VKALWHRRPVRHLLAGLIPLLLVGAALLAVLASRYAAAAAPLRDATARAVATVERSGLGADRRGVELSWTDEHQVRRTGVVRASGPGSVPAGAGVDIRYVPSDPSRVYAAGDETEARVRDIGFGLVLVVLVLIIAVVVSVVHVVRRLAAERRPGTPMPVRYVRTRRRLLRRSWLVVDDQDREWWVPVHWEPELGEIGSGTPATVHGRPGRQRVLAIDAFGTTVWQAAGRVRATPPRGEVSTDEDVWSSPSGRSEPESAGTPPVDIGVARHLRTDGALLVAAPVIGLAWAYVDDAGWGGAVVATVLVAALLVWLPTLLGSDPT